MVNSSCASLHNSNQQTHSLNSNKIMGFGVHKPADGALTLGLESSEGSNDGVIPRLALHISVEFVRGESDDRPSCAPLQ